LLTSSRVKINNYAGYVQNGIDFFHGHLHIETGLRLDYFGFNVDGFEQSDAKILLNGKTSDAKFQPKFSAAWSPFEKFPTVFYFNYGRGISSQDARGIVRQPDSPKISTTDFYQTGAAYNTKRLSLAPSFFLIDRSSEQVYVPDDGTIEFAGRSRSYGFEIKTSARFNRFLSFNGSLTQVIRAFYPGQFTSAKRRVFVDDAPQTTASGSLILSELRGFNSSLNWRHISGYSLDGANKNLRASGNDVLDFSLSKRLRKWVALNFSIDNVLNNRYFETQNYFESRISPSANAVSRIHATPGYPTTFNFGFTFRFFAKQ
jgi:outer membrane receptor for monomeric catechols